MASKQITQNPQRYTQQGNRWAIQSAPQIIPIILEGGTPIPVKPLIQAYGIVVKVGNDYLISKQTLKDIQDSKNPHWDINETGQIGIRNIIVKTGLSVPIIEVKTEGLAAKIGEQDGKTPFAGVASVDYLTETELVDGVPKGLIDQIDYTLTVEGERPSDRFTLWDLALSGDYSITQLNIDTAQEDGTLDQKKLETFLSGIGDRLKTLRSDFNTIKRIHYLGEQPSGSSLTTTEYTQVASSEESGSNDEQLVIKETKGVGFEPSLQTGGSSPSSGSMSGTPTVPGSPEVPEQGGKREWVLNRTPDAKLKVDAGSPVLKSANLQTYPLLGRGVYRENLVKLIKLNETFTGKKIGDTQTGAASIWEVYDIVDTEKVIGYLYVEGSEFIIKPKG